MDAKGLTAHRAAREIEAGMLVSLRLGLNSAGLRRLSRPTRAEDPQRRRERPRADRREDLVGTRLADRVGTGRDVSAAVTPTGEGPSGSRRSHSFPS